MNKINKETWPLNITNIRRADWNEFVKTKLIPLNCLPAAGYIIMHKQEERQGWTWEDLKEAVAIHEI